MSRAELRPDFVAALYAAALENDDLGPLSQLVQQTVGAGSSGIWLVDNGQIVDIAIHGGLADAKAPWLAHFITLDIWHQNRFRIPPDQAVLGYEHTSEQFLVKTEFYNDFARQLGLFRPMTAMLRLGPDIAATVALERPSARKLFTDEDKPRLQRLVPHLRGALTLRYRQRQRIAMMDSQSSALNALAFGAIICEVDGRIVLANIAAEALARAGTGIRLTRRGKSIGAVVIEDARKLLALIHDAASGGTGGGIRLTGQDGVAALLVLVAPLPGNLGGGRAGRALIAMRSVRDEAALQQEILVALFGLSPVQATIALALWNGWSPEEIATARGIRISTLRTHLTEIFARTGAENQRDLVRMLGLLPPIR